MDIVRKPHSEREQDGKKAVIYLGSRSAYETLETAVKSVYANSDVDAIYLGIEDDEFPYHLPECAEIINISHQPYFKASSPNNDVFWAYITMCKIAVPKLLPEWGRALILDFDTVVVDDISSLWDIDLQGNYYAGVPDNGIYRAPGKPRYCNAGVTLMDLDLIRDNGMDDEIINALNHKRFLYREQCAMNQFCYGHILELPVRYNESFVTGITDHPAIVHYVGMNKETGGVNGSRRHYFNSYRDMPWEEAEKRHAEKIARRK